MDGLLADDGLLAVVGLLAVTGALAGVASLAGVVAGAVPVVVGLVDVLLFEPPPPPHALRKRAPIKMAYGILKRFVITCLSELFAPATTRMADFA
ncbi:hypothetical protein AXG89_30940 (plasmid) [Burkholderia sp. PAMC 26561]|nr:hypothetical protein AXG89_30940 [Burkholderia sp. PAMC 26561]